MVFRPRPDVALEGELTYFAEGLERERRELTIRGGQRLVQVVSGERSLEMQDGVPSNRDLLAEARVRRRYRRLFADMADDPARVALVAEAEVADEPAIVLERRETAQERWQLWLDARTLFATRIRRIVDLAGKTHVFEDRLAQHERVGDRVVPRRLETWFDGVRLMESWLLDYDVAPLLDPALFELDRG